MTKLYKLTLTALFCALIALSNLSSISADDESSLEDEQPKPSSDDSQSAPPEEVSTETGLQSSIDADVTFAFTRPVIEKPYEFPIGKEIHFLVGFKNKGQKDFHINTMGASFRYALDFSYALQNFSSYSYNKVIEPNQEATLGYSFYVNEAYVPRSYGFLVNLLYADKDGVQYENTVFNQTVTLVEVDEGLDGETFFLYILLIGLTGLIVYGLNQLYIKYFGVPRKQTTKPVEYAKAVNTKEVDYDWLPNTVGNIKKISSGNNKKAPAN